MPLERLSRAASPCEERRLPRSRLHDVALIQGKLGVGRCLPSRELQSARLTMTLRCNNHWTVDGAGKTPMLNSVVDLLFSIVMGANLSWMK